MRVAARLLLALTLGATVPVATARAADVRVADRQPASAADARAIRRVIRAQLDALRHDDAKSAFLQAAPSIQEHYGTPDVFLDVVKRHYAAVYHARAAWFGRLARWRGSLTQEVAIVAQDGRRYVALYPMQKQPNGTWRIAGCVIMRDLSI